MKVEWNVHRNSFNGSFKFVMDCPLENIILVVLKSVCVYTCAHVCNSGIHTWLELLLIMD